jgi:hypothetical protein
MYSLTPLEGMLLGLGLLLTITMLVMGVQFIFPRAIRIMTAGVDYLDLPPWGFHVFEMTAV